MKKSELKDLIKEELLKEGKKLESSLIRMNKSIERELNVIREEAKTDNRTLKYQTILWTIKKHIEQL